MDWRTIFEEAPSAENGVYLALGLVWDQVWADQKFTLSFTKFEAKPGDHPRSGGKWLDAIATRRWKAADRADDTVGVEFKLRSSGLFADLQKLPDFRPDILICWRHDAPGAEYYARQIIELVPYFDGAEARWDPPAERRAAGFCAAVVDPRARAVAAAILAEWKEIWPTGAELRLSRDAVPVARLNNYKVPRLTLFAAPDDPLVADLISHPSVVRNKGTTAVLLPRVEQADVPVLLRIMKAISAGAVAKCSSS